MFFKKGKLVFIEALKEESTIDLAVTYFTAKALVISEKDGEYYGTVEVLNISDLIQKTSIYVYDGLNTREAHKLYTWPVNLGDSKSWGESKRIFLEQQVLNFPINILAVQEEKYLTWEFISPEQFKNIPSGLQASPEFQNYLDHKEEYFFLRKERNEPV
ncbi:hypothetical protein AAKU52_001482 [Pedobacter sp. CG_S7]|uniref:hypothetical protein n=1 Tax=Pedobacter sp. CG_S7 TaxID=3143930 RepID=UPI0033943546